MSTTTTEKAAMNETQANTAKQAKQSKAKQSQAKPSVKDEKSPLELAIAELHVANVIKNDDGKAKAKASYLGNLNTLPSQGMIHKTIAMLAKHSPDEKHVLDVIQGATLYLRNEASLAYKQVFKDGGGASVSIDKKNSVVVGSAKKDAYDALVACQKAVIADQDAMKKVLTYVRPASK